MFARALLPVLFLLSCRERQLTRRSEAGEPCSSASELLPEVGACRNGRLQPTPDGGLECAGEVIPVPELCNGADDDCDGAIDNGVAPAWCSTACGVGFQQCSNGTWTECNAPRPAPELCDGVDNDCDGEIDEANDLLPPPTGWGCFTAPLPASPQLGACHGGTWRCGDARWACFGEQPPTAEVCDGADNDCDGLIDEGVGPPKALNVVIVFDNSGSMQDVATTLKAIISAWPVKYAARTNWLYALVGAPNNSPVGCRATLEHDFTDASGISAAMQQQTGSSGSGLENTLGAIEGIIGSQNTFGLDWAVDAERLILLFSDELPQHYDADCTEVSDATRNSIAASLVFGSAKLHVFTRRSNQPDWAPYATAGHGQTWDIATRGEQLATILDSIVAGAACQ